VRIGDHAGMVIVNCAPGPGGGTTVAVRYELTALKADANAGLDAFAAGYQGFLESWQDSIEAALASAEDSQPSASSVSWTILARSSTRRPR
jgi:hypothetical protein